MRRGMTAGADDYLAKPFTRVELLEALQGLLTKRGRIEESIASAVRSREEHLQRAFTESLGGRRLADKFGLEAPAGAVADQVVQATVLFSDIRGFTSLAEMLSANEVAQLLTGYFERIAGPLLTNGARHLKFIGDGLVAVFPETADSPLAAARRGISAALAIALAAHEFRAWIDGRFPGRGLPPFAIGVGLHAGEVALCGIGPPGSRETLPVGDAVNAAARLEVSSKELGWTVVASDAVMQQAGAGVQTGGMTAIEAGAKIGWLDAAEITGLVANSEDERHGMAALTERAGDIRAAVEVNSEITARAVKGALASKLSAFKDHEFGTEAEPVRLKGYRLLRKIGAGGMTVVYLAVRESDAMAVVLKVLSASGRASGENLARFVQEYAILSRIEHPHVIRIYDQGFTDDHAYIAMEYFQRGDLRGELKAGMKRERVIEVVAQVAQALGAIHSHGIIHRDLKPENIMLRTDGQVALADFGAAKSILAPGKLPLAETRNGGVVGTPYYLSPEQAKGERITPATDLYSLGVMLYEMLAGRRPYAADSLHELLAQHVSAPTPELGAQDRLLQPVLERLMAKEPRSRYGSAQALLDDLEARKLLEWPHDLPRTHTRAPGDGP
jgi:class 3 adenylate cyclase